MKVERTKVTHSLFLSSFFIVFPPPPPYFYWQTIKNEEEEKVKHCAQCKKRTACLL